MLMLEYLPKVAAIEPLSASRPLAVANRTARVAGGQKYEVAYKSKKTGRSESAVKKVGGSRKKVARRLGARECEPRDSSANSAAVF